MESGKILRDLGIGTVKLLTNNPHKLESLANYGVRVVHVPLEVKPHRANIDYLRTKKESSGTCCRNSSSWADAGS